MSTFRKRFFKNPGELFSMMGEMLKQAKRVRKLEKHEKISPALAEKTMLAVTGVTNCVFCSYLHTKTALEKGVNDEEVVKLLNSEFGDFPEEEVVALLFGQHWAETEGKPSAEAKDRLISFYGEGKAIHIEFTIRVLYLGNMISNTVEAYRKHVQLEKNRFQFFLAYLLCVPIAFYIRTSGKAGKAFLADKSVDYLRETE